MVSIVVAGAVVKGVVEVVAEVVLAVKVAVVVVLQLLPCRWFQLALQKHARGVRRVRENERNAYTYTWSPTTTFLIELATHSRFELHCTNEFMIQYTACRHRYHGGMVYGNQKYEQHLVLSPPAVYHHVV